MSWDWIDVERAGPRYLNRGALRHSLRMVERERQSVGVPMIVLPARCEDWEVEVYRGMLSFRDARALLRLPRLPR